MTFFTLLQSTGTTPPVVPGPYIWGGDDAPRTGRGLRKRRHEDEYLEERSAKERLREQIRVALEGPQADEVVDAIRPYVPKKQRKQVYAAPPPMIDWERLMDNQRALAAIERAAQAAIEDEEAAIHYLLLN